MSAYISELQQINKDLLKQISDKKSLFKENFALVESQKNQIRDLEMVTSQLTKSFEKHEDLYNSL